jgi:hypothetical protein
MTAEPPNSPEESTGLGPRPADGAGKIPIPEGWHTSAAAPRREPETAGPGPGRPTRLRRGPFSRVVFGLVALGLVASALWAVRSDGPATPVLLATADLPAFHSLTSADFTMRTRRTRDKERYATLPVDGRVTLRAVKKGTPLLRADVGPDAARALRANVVVVGVNVTKAAVLGGALRTGERVQLVLSEKGNRTTALDALVMSVVAGSGGKDWSLVVALKADEGRRYSPSLASNEIAVLRDPAAKDD